jgi:hypothetical protein
MHGSSVSFSLSTQGIIGPSRLFIGHRIGSASPFSESIKYFCKSCIVIMMITISHGFAGT